MHVQVIILGRREQVIVTQGFNNVSGIYEWELSKSVTYKADFQEPKQAAVARAQGQAGYLMLCLHLYWKAETAAPGLVLPRKH
jgi:hypothetical protein